MDMSARDQRAGDVTAPGPMRLETSRFASANRRRLGAPGLRTFLAIADLWGLGEDQRLRVLGMPSRSTYYGWVKAAREHRDVTLDVDVLLRISAVLGVYQALRVLNDTEAAGLAWLHTPHAAPLFGGRPPLELMTNGTQDGLILVRRFLDAARGGLYLGPTGLDLEFDRYTDKDVVFT
jgi:hypothetical protein